MKSQLKAFVGHSFTDDDQVVVQKFLKFLTQIAEIDNRFSWEHAEHAEPKELADKVLQLIEDKNLFIGICTKKEAVIEQHKLSRSKSKKKILIGDEAEFSFKTSDWIIQEIGLAIGRAMSIILLLENGIRQPGGLQGNLEFISFERDAPEKSFGKILEMVQFLLPKARAVLVEQSESRAIPEKQAEAEEQPMDDKLQPQEDWDFQKYRFALLRKTMTDDAEGAEKINEAFLASHLVQQTEYREMWEALGEYFRILLGKGGKLTKLEVLAKMYPENAQVQGFLARAYNQYEDYNRAATQYKVAAEKATNKDDEFMFYGKTALSYTRNGLKHEADVAIGKMKAFISEVENGEVEFIRILNEIADITDNKDLYFGLTEQLLHINPDDMDSRFRLAFKYSEINKNELALYHYLKIPYGERGAGTWNNIGVGFYHCNLSSKSIKAYREAEKLGETLAMANLANKLIDSGFLDEAEEICKQALKNENYHKNVIESISRIKSIPEEEEKQEKTILDMVRPLSEFYKGYGHASMSADIGDHEGNWRGPLCDLKLVIKDNQLIANGSYEEKKQEQAVGLAAAFGGGIGVEGLQKKKHKRVKYEGQIFGKAVKGFFTEKADEEDGILASLLTSSERKSDVLMILSEDLREIKVYEKDTGKDLKFYSLKRIE